MRLLILILALVPALAFAAPLPRPESTTVNDWAGVLSPATEEALSRDLRALRKDTGVHAVIVTMGRIADHGGAGMGFEAYATKLFNEWGIGDRARDDGILILVATDDRAMRIELGDGFGRDWDALAKDVIDDTFLPALAEGQPETAIRRGTDQVISRIARPFAKGENQPWPHWSYWALMAAGLAIPVLAIGGFMAHLFGWLRRCPSCGGRGMAIERKTLVAATTSTAGTGEETARCRHCGFTTTSRYDISADRDRSGGGGRGFGGGSSSGGGGSGRW